MTSIKKISVIIMNLKSIIFISLILILTLPVVSASDVNGTLSADYTFMGDAVVCEDEIADESFISPDKEIISEEKTPGIDKKSDASSFEIVNPVEYSKECVFEIQNYETSIGFFNDSQFCDMNFKSDEKLDTTFNNFSITSFIKLNFSFENMGSFESFLIKMEDLDSESFRLGKFNSFTVEHELIVYVLHKNDIENYLDCNIIICSNKATDNFAYSINNSVIGDESSVIYCIFNSSYFINQNYLFNYNSYYVSIFHVYYYDGCLDYKYYLLTKKMRK